MKRRQMQKRKPPSPPSDPPTLVEIPLTPAMIHGQAEGHLEPHLRCFRWGELGIMVGHAPDTGWHISVSHTDRYPTWDEIVAIRYALLPGDVHMAMLLPPREQYVNIHDNCFHLYQVR